MKDYGTTYSTERPEEVDVASLRSAENFILHKKLQRRSYNECKYLSKQ